MRISKSELEQIRLECERRKITRLCHFTKFCNIPHIFDTTAVPSGILSREVLKEYNREYFAMDKRRVDKREDLICCTIEYPNSYLLNRVVKQNPNDDWVIFLIDSTYIWKKDTYFCPCNAAKSWGAFIRNGIDGFNSLFNSKSEGKGYDRTKTHLEFSPTDFQAEVLVTGPILLESINGIVAETQDQSEKIMEEISKHPEFEINVLVCAEVFSSNLVPFYIKYGEKEQLVKEFF